MIDVQPMSEGFATGADIETGAGCVRVVHGDDGRADGQEAARAETPAAGGRPLVLDATKRAEVCAMLAAGCSFRTAARYVGVTAGAISLLLKRDETFRVQVDKALANREFIPLSQIRGRRQKLAGGGVAARADGEGDVSAGQHRGPGGYLGRGGQGVARRVEDAHGFGRGADAPAGADCGVGGRRGGGLRAGIRVQGSGVRDWGTGVRSGGAVGGWRVGGTGDRAWQVES